jgi:hypothetical protein
MTRNAFNSSVWCGLRPHDDFAHHRFVTVTTIKIAVKCESTDAVDAEDDAVVA